MRSNLKKGLPWLVAVLAPLAYLCLYTPYGMDTTDFGYFYGYGWRILEGQMPYRDFAYIKPALPLYWHALWMWLTPDGYEILAGKCGFLLSLLLAAWFCALYFARLFRLDQLPLSLPLLATTGFVFSVHSFPHMPWHTADGVLFSSFALWLAATAHPFASGLLCACAFLCKQSFLLLPAGLAIFLYTQFPSRKKLYFFLAGFFCALGIFILWIMANHAWEDFRRMTTGQLDPREALDAGLLIYLRQNWLLPGLALLPWLIIRFFRLRQREWLMPAYVYLALLATWYVQEVYWQETWIGFGASWPTLFMLLGGICVLRPGSFLVPWYKPVEKWPRLAPAASLGVALLASWSVAISGGYKIPAMQATPLIFSFCLVHRWLGGLANRLLAATLICGLVIFAAGYQYPYVFPIRQLARQDLKLDAGEIYPMARGVKVDAVMYEKLRELKALREKYGSAYKTLPGFSMAYYLNRDYPVYGSDWLIDWEINGEVDRLYQELLDKKLTVFMEKDQLYDEKADNYERAGYGVPQRVRKLWRIVEETPHFVVFQPPLASDAAR